jgi:hypothetical protein
MIVTIIKDDNAVIIDGVRHKVDCDDLPADFHALQWDGTAGEIEYCAIRCDHCGARSKKSNQMISDLAPYEKYIDVWRAAEVIAASEKIAAAEKLTAK